MTTILASALLGVALQAPAAAQPAIPNPQSTPNPQSIGNPQSIRNPQSAIRNDYASADIAYGARLYDAQCTTCHSANGDGIAGVDFKGGRFKSAVTDQDLQRTITTGVQGTAMQAFSLDPSEMAG